MRRLAVYAHYSAESTVQPHILYFLRELRLFQFEICFVSNSPLSSQSRQELAASCGKIIERENTGLDFAMWQRGLADYQLAEWDEVLLTNSSIVGPLRPLAPIWEHSAIADGDFWGLTDSAEIAPHVQSYFLVFRRRVLQHPCFAAFWRAVLPYREKNQIIRSYEIGLTRWLEENGFRSRVVFPKEEICALFLRQQSLLQRTIRLRFFRALPRRNLSLFLPDVLFQRGMPFVKASLLERGKEKFRLVPAQIFRLVQESNLPVEIVNGIGRNYHLLGSREG